MSNSKITFFGFLLALAHVLGDYSADTITNKVQMPIFCHFNGTNVLMNFLNNWEFDANLCTYVVIIGNVDLHNWTIKLAHSEWEETIANDMYKLKAANNNLKFIISISRVANEANYFPLLAYKHHREFAENAKLFIRNYKFDGIHIDWWYPGTDWLVYYEDEDDDSEDSGSYFKASNDSNTEDEDDYSYKDEDYDSYSLNSVDGNYTEEEYDENDKDDDEDDKDFDDDNTHGRTYFLRLIKELKSQLSEDGTLIAVSIGPFHTKNLERSYDFTNLKGIIDYWFVMSLGYSHSSWIFMRKILQDAPILTNNPAVGVKAMVDSVKKAIGLDYSNKIVLDIPFHAAMYKLRATLKENQNPFEKQITRRINGLFSYSAICRLVKQIKQNNGTWTYKYNTTAEAPYLVRRKTVLLYEDSQSVRAKTNFAINEGLGGVMSYKTAADDHIGICSCNENIKYPLLKTIYDTIHSPTSERWKTYQQCL